MSNEDVQDMVSGNDVPASISHSLTMSDASNGTLSASAPARRVGLTKGDGRSKAASVAGGEGEENLDGTPLVDVNALPPMNNPAPRAGKGKKGTKAAPPATTTTPPAAQAPAAQPAAKPAPSPAPAAATPAAVPKPAQASVTPVGKRPVAKTSQHASPAPTQGEDFAGAMTGEASPAPEPECPPGAPNGQPDDDDGPPDDNLAVPQDGDEPPMYEDGDVGGDDVGPPSDTSETPGRVLPGETAPQAANRIVNHVAKTQATEPPSDQPWNVRDPLATQGLIEEQVTALLFELGVILLGNRKAIQENNPVHEAIFRVKHDTINFLENGSPRQLGETEMVLASHATRVRAIENRWRARYVYLGKELERYMQSNRRKHQGDKEYEKEAALLEADEAARKLRYHFLVAQFTSTSLEGMGDAFRQLEDSMKRSIDYVMAEHSGESRTQNQ